MGFFEDPKRLGEASVPVASLYALFIDIPAIVDDFHEGAPFLGVEGKDDPDFAGADAIISGPNAGEPLYVNGNGFAKKFPDDFANESCYKLVGEMILRDELSRLAR